MSDNEPIHPVDLPRVNTCSSNDVLMISVYPDGNTAQTAVLSSISTNNFINSISENIGSSNALSIQLTDLTTASPAIIEVGTTIQESIAALAPLLDHQSWVLLDANTIFTIGILSFDLSAYTQYSDIKIAISGIRTTFDGDLLCRLSSDGTNYFSSDYEFNALTAPSGTGQNAITMAPSWSYGEDKWHGDVSVDLMHRLDGSGWPKVHYRVTWWKEGIGLQGNEAVGAYTAAPSQLNGIQFFFSAGNFSALRYSIWGSPAP